MDSWLIWTLVAAVFVVILYLYMVVVGHHLTVAGVAMAKDDTVANAQGFFATLDAKLTNWKTVILALIAGLAQLSTFVTTDVVKEWQDLPWAQVVDPKVANLITLVCTFLIPIVHAMGIAKAAVTPPQS